MRKIREKFDMSVQNCKEPIKCNSYCVRLIQ